MKISDFLNEKDIFIFQSCKNKEDFYNKVLPKLIETENNSKMSREDVIKIIEEREKDCSFVIKEDYAIPHTRIDKLNKPIVKFSYIRDGLEFEKGKRCSFILLFITPLTEAKTHLQIMSKVPSLLKKEEIIHRIRNAKDSSEIFQAICAEENIGNIEYLTIDKESIFSELESSENGLSDIEAEERIKKIGKNLLRKAKETPQLIKFLKNIVSLFAILLWIGGFLCFIPGVNMPQLGWAIFTVIIVNAIFSYWQEFKAEKAVEALQKMIPNKTKVLRDGKMREIDSSDVVYGDIVFFNEGDIISADARLLETYEMNVNNSMLTGESRTIYKVAEPIKGEFYFLWTEIPNMIFAGTSVSSGSGKAIVIGTGMNTEVGNIAAITQALRKEMSPLQKEMKRAVNTITVISITLGILFFFLGKMFGGLSYIAAFIFTIGITVANIPEGLLPTLTLALAMGVTRMAKRNVLVKELASVETLGSASIICTDKTGTITTNKISVCKLFISGETYSISGDSYNPNGDFLGENDEKVDKSSLYNRGDISQFINISLLCNNSTLNKPLKENENWTISGDPTEAALLVLVEKLIVDSDKIRSANKRINHFPFESLRKMMTIINLNNEGELFAFTKGAPLETLEKCKYLHYNGEIRELSETDKETIKIKNDEFASKGLRVLAFAYKKCDKNNTDSKEETEKDLIFLAMTGMIDPHRAEVPEAVKKCKTAGIKIFIITGDYGLTARAIAHNIGLIDTPDNCIIINGIDLSKMTDIQLQELLKGNMPVIFSRMEPIQKMRIVTCAKQLDEIVAVTGDGVNDAIALKSADIGIAMGNDASAAAKEAASMIILDGNFASIVYAIEEGRAVYGNIKRFVTYIFSSNVPELVPFILFVMLKIPLPLTVMQILAIDLGTDLVPALGLGVEKAELGIMNKPPRKKTDKLIDLKLFLRGYFFLGMIETTLCMGAYMFAYYSEGWRIGEPMENSGKVYMLATTMSLVGIVMGQVGNIFCCRTDKESVFKVGLLSNKLVLVGVGSEIILILVFLYIPFFNKVFGLVPLGLKEWSLLLTFPFIILSLEEGRKFIIRRK